MSNANDQARATNQQQNTPEESIKTWHQRCGPDVCAVALSPFSSAAELPRTGFWRALLQDAGGYWCKTDIAARMASLQADIATRRT